MKKVSTAAARQTKNFSDRKLTIGLDLGDRSSWYCVLDEAGAAVPALHYTVAGGAPGATYTCSLASARVTLTSIFFLPR